jgi:DNA-binding transcriptional LysR family regulator
MELRHLRYLVAVADAGTFVRAAEHLRVAQPALSRQINDLEKELKVELFEEGARKATLTDAGHAAVRLARHVIDDTERAIGRARMSNQGTLGECGISAGPLPLMTGLVGQLVARMRARHPEVRIRVVEGAYPRLWDLVAAGETDIALGTSPPASYKTLATEVQLTHVVDTAVVAPEHPLATRDSVTLADLQGTPYLGLETMSPEVEAARDMLLRELKRQKLETGNVRFFSSLESAVAHVRAGQGWTLLPRAFAATMSPLVMVRVEDFQAPFRTMRAWRRADTRPITRTVLTELRALQQQGLSELEMQQLPDRNAVRQEFIPARLDLRHLRSFLLVAEHGSLGRAAEALDLSQPALSRQMRELEYDVGVELLVRVTRGVELTPAGEALQSDARGLLTIVDRLPAEVLRAKRGSQERRCVIGVVPHPHVDTIVAVTVAEMEGRNPRVRVGTRGVDSPAQAAALTTGDIDLAIGFRYPARVPTGNEFARVPLFDDEVSHAILATNSPLAGRTELSLADLALVPFMWGPRRFFPGLYDAVMHQFELAGVRPRIEGEYAGLQTIWSLAAQGLGWTLGWQGMTHQPPPGTAMVRITDYRLPWGADLIYRKDESRAPILSTIDAMLEAARQLFPPKAGVTSGTLPPANASRAVMS